jgi:hypothetical protein
MTPSAAVILSAGVGTALAALSFQLVERPFQDSQRLRRSALPTLIVALAWTALVWFVLLPWLLDNDAPRRVVSLESESVSQPAVLESKTPIPPYVPTDPALKEIGFDQDCFGEPFESCVIVPGDGLRIHVMGDSHARAIIPAFAEVAESNGYRLSVSVAASCTWQRNYYYTDTDEQRPECDLERPDWYERVLPELDPDLIVMVNRPFDDPQNPWVMESDSPELAGLGQQELHEAVTRRSLDALSELDARLVVVEQTPIARSSGFPCLSEATWVEECAFDATPGPSPTEQQLRRFASNSDQLWTIDMDSVACPRLPACDPFVGENLVRYDAQHLSVPFARAAGSQVWKLVDEAGVLDGIEAEH